MKRIIITLIFSLASSLSIAGTAMNIEGTCSGTQADGTKVSFTYFSNFDGCKEKSKAAISFSEGREGLFTGKRSFKDGKDIYSYSVKNGGEKKELVRLTFADSTGQTSGSMRYLDEEDEKTVRSLALQCQIRDYHYAECGEEF